MDQLKYFTSRSHRACGCSQIAFASTSHVFCCQCPELMSHSVLALKQGLFLKILTHPGVTVLTGRKAEIILRRAAKSRETHNEFTYTSTVSTLWGNAETHGNAQAHVRNAPLHTCCLREKLPPSCGGTLDLGARRFGIGHYWLRNLHTVANTFRHERCIKIRKHTFYLP